MSSSNAQVGLYLVWAKEGPALEMPEVWASYYQDSERMTASTYFGMFIF